MNFLKKVSNDIYYVGYSDRKITLFENYIPLTRGVSYNSYLIVDDKTCLLDTVDFSCVREFLNKVKEGLNGRKLDYLVIHHMEPDHCASIEEILIRYPEVKIVTNAQVLKMLYQFFDCNLDGKVELVKENDVLDLGNHKLQFIFAPMVHWPEVMVSYDLTEKILFSADAFGCFGAHSGNIFYDEVRECDYISESRRYYSNIVGKYGQNVLNLFKKLADKEIKMICPLHGYLWRENIDVLLDKYTKWASYKEEDRDVIIIYASMYGNTEYSALRLADVLSNLGVKNIKVYDVSNVDSTYLISEIFRVSHVVFASPTYNTTIYPKMNYLIENIIQLNVQNKTFAVIENGTWAITINKQIRDRLAVTKNNTFLEEKVSFKSSLKESNDEDILRLATAIKESLYQ